MAQVRSPHGRKVRDNSKFNRSRLVPFLRDHILCLHHEQETPIPADKFGPVGPDYGAILFAT